MGDNIEWQRIERDMLRARVHGGWIVQKGGGGDVALVFVPDPDHKWACTDYMGDCPECGTSGTLGSGESRKKCPKCKGKGGHYH